VKRRAVIPEACHLAVAALVGCQRRAEERQADEHGECGRRKRDESGDAADPHPSSLSGAGGNRGPMEKREDGCGSKATSTPCGKPCAATSSAPANVARPSSSDRQRRRSKSAQLHHPARQATLCCK